MNHIQSVLPDCRLLIKKGASVEQILFHLKNCGINKVESVFALEMLGLASLREGKILVHNSETWSDAKANDEALHDSLIRALEELQETQDKSSK